MVLGSFSHPDVTSMIVYGTHKRIIFKREPRVIYTRQETIFFFFLTGHHTRSVSGRDLYIFVTVKLFTTVKVQVFLQLVTLFLFKKN